VTIELKCEHCHQASVAPRVLWHKDVEARYTNAASRRVSDGDAPSRQESFASRTVREEDAHGTGCLRLSAPPGLDFVLPEYGALRTNVPKPAIVRSKHADEAATLDSLDVLETSRLLDKMCIKAARTTRGAAPSAPTHTHTHTASDSLPHVGDAESTACGSTRGAAAGARGGGGP